MTGATPRKLNALPDSRTPPKLSGVKSPLSRTVSYDVAITSENAGSFCMRRNSSSVCPCPPRPSTARTPGADLIRARVRIRRDQHAVDHTEDCRGCPDAQRERQQRDCGERRAATKRSRCIPEILNEGFQPPLHRHTLPSVRLCLRRLWVLKGLPDKFPP